jgi:hypothetical protein
MVGGRVRHLVPVVVAVAVLLCAGRADAATTTIGFDDQPDGTAVGAQYSGLGVQLDPPGSLSVETNALAHSGAKLLRATDHTCAGSSTVAFTALLSTPRSTVGIWVHDPYANDPSSRTVTLQAFDAANGDAGHTSLSITSALGWQQLLLPAVPGKSIDHFAVTVDAGICTMLFDDLSFDAAAGAEPPSVAWEAPPAQPVAVERGGSTSATATLRRRGGSTGRVDLAVTGLPSGVSAELVPVQANGSDLRGPVAIKLTGSTTAAPTGGPVPVTLRATPVDATAGAGIPVETTFPVVVQPPSVSLALAAPAPTDLYRSDGLTVAAQVVRHSLSSGRVTLAATAPAGVSVSVSPATLDGSAPTTPVSVAISVAADAPRDPNGTIRIVASSTDPAAAPPGQDAELRLAAPVRVPSLEVTSPIPPRLLLRAGAGTSRVDALVKAVDLPPDAVVRAGVQGVPTDVEIAPGLASWNAAAGDVLFTAGLTARSGLTNASSQTPSIYAVADIPGHGTVSSVNFFDLTVVPTIRYALAARGIEVTQGTQAIGPKDCSSIPTRDLSHIDSSVPYTGVRLVDGDPTVARVYVSAWLLTNTTSLPNVGVRLHAYRNGREVPGSPLSPNAAPSVVKQGDLNCVTTADRASPDNVYSYVLPPSWTFGTVTLQAEILPIAPTVTGSVLDECGTLFCQTFKRFTLRSVAFTRLGWPGIMPIRISANGRNPGSADAALFPARTLHPGDPYVWGYQGDEDISDLVALADAAALNPLLAKLSRRDIIEGGTAQRVRLWSEILPGRSIVAGLAPAADSVFGVANGRTITDLPAPTPLSPRPSMVAITSRPLTSVAHELAHLLGRPHAGRGCPGTAAGDGQAGEPWPPDDQGLLQGVGLDLSRIADDPVAFKATAATPYRVIERGLPNAAPEFYDLMSYCASTNEVPSPTTAPNAWLSPRGWDAEVATLEAWTQKTGGAIGVARAVAPASPVLTVGAIGRDGSAAIIDVTPGTGSPLAAGTDRPVLVGYDAAGAEVTRAGLDDQLLADSGLHTYTGSLPAARVVRVAIVDPTGARLADRAQSAHAPHVLVTAPRKGATVGGSRPVRVAWKAGDADGGRVRATVETSADDGRTWRRIYQGPSTSTALPAAYFAGSAKARVRVSVNDGFRSTSVVSGRFTALRAPASVHIDSPRTGTSVDSDGSLTLAGRASTLRGPVSSGRLIWRLAGRQIARGARTAVRNLPPGRRVLTLGVRGDPRALAKVAVVVRAVTPPFLRVSLPSRIPASARSVLVRLRSGTTATVGAAGRSVRIKARGRAVLRVPVRPGRTELALTLTARALGHDYVFTRAVRRR